MFDNPGKRYTTVLARLAAELDDDERALPLLCATSLARHWELLDPATTIADGRLYVASQRFSSSASTARIVELPTTLGLHRGAGSVAQVLGFPPGRTGQLIELHRLALSTLELPFDVTLESLPVLQLEALVRVAPSQDHRHAVLAAAGLRTRSPRAMRRRQNLDPAISGWIAEQTDAYLHHAAPRLASTAAE